IGGLPRAELGQWIPPLAEEISAPVEPDAPQAAPRLRELPFEGTTSQFQEVGFRQFELLEGIGDRRPFVDAAKRPVLGPPETDIEGARILFERIAEVLFGGGEIGRRVPAVLR